MFLFTCYPEYIFINLILSCYQEHSVNASHESLFSPITYFQFRIYSKFKINIQKTNLFYFKLLYVLDYFKLFLFNLLKIFFFITWNTVI